MSSDFALLDEPKARTHLAFSCQIADAIFTDAGDGSSTASRYVVEASVAVLFLYRIRASRQADVDKAAEALEKVGVAGESRPDPALFLFPLDLLRLSFDCLHPRSVSVPVPPRS